MSIKQVLQVKSCGDYRKSEQNRSKVMHMEPLSYLKQAANEKYAVNCCIFVRLMRRLSPGGRMQTGTFGIKKIIDTL